ncbi:stigma-specific STIG1-like protein 2 [Heracleum sosnowskyi]|uniref:Stigma-specific STIG1-like protein 2 n=1 Tax=Heracleum sosnowskyi TaxID=360622 RepID=A0AAD8M3R3_9APIA|nr:stigma-specific STIG1-like protein 2 [Heracleum sosnowskyi]
MVATTVRVIVFVTMMSMALTALLTMKHLSFDGKSSSDNIDVPSKESNDDEVLVMPFKRVNRFLAEEKNPRAADHCHKDNEVCSLQGTNSTCCNNKCMDLSTDKKNCGACKNKCKYTETCCRGECVDVTYDKRHCGECNNACSPGGYCIYGLCDYA